MIDIDIIYLICMFMLGMLGGYLIGRYFASKDLLKMLDDYEDRLDNVIKEMKEIRKNE